MVCSPGAGVPPAMTPHSEYPAPCNAPRFTVSHDQEHRSVRTDLKILKIWSISESPGNNGCPRMHISAKIHPTDHMSIAVE